MDFSNLKELLVDGIKLVELKINGVLVWVAKTFTNQVPISTDTDGSIYNGTGYKDNARLSSSGGVSGSAQAGSVTTGFIPWTPYQPIRIKGATWGRISGQHYYLHFYDANKTNVQDSNSALSGDGYEAGNFKGHITVTYDSSTGVTTFSFDNPNMTTGLTSRIKNAKYIRLNAKGTGANLIVTVNEEIA
jgi:hypothetical protein